MQLEQLHKQRSVSPLIGLASLYLDCCCTCVKVAYHMQLEQLHKQRSVSPLIGLASLYLKPGNLSQEVNAS